MVRKIVEDALGLLSSNYVFPEKAAYAVEAIRMSCEAGEYDNLSELALGDALTERLLALCGDQHLRVRPRKPGYEAAVTAQELDAARHQELRRANHGIARVERLDGNIGYLDIRLITHPDVGGRAIAAAMELVSHTHALIVDLRHNDGGSVGGVIFWNSYFFADDTHFNDIYDRETGQTRQFWRMDYLPGERYLDRPVWVLTSSSTFSGGEQFCYDLQAQGRVTVIGETTRGGAHPTKPFPLTATLEITIPIARSINPVTGTNWEGIGVQPDVATTAEEALPLAYRRALEHVIASVADPQAVTEAQLHLIP